MLLSGKMDGNFFKILGDMILYVAMYQKISDFHIIVEIVLKTVHPLHRKSEITQRIFGI